MTVAKASPSFLPSSFALKTDVMPSSPAGNKDPLLTGALSEVGSPNADAAPERIEVGEPPII